MRPATEPDDWINGRQAAQIVGCSPTAIIRAAMLGQVKTRLTPGVPARYCRADVVRLAASRAKAKPQPAGA